MSSLVSVVITAFNQALYLEQAVQSVLAQTYPQIECLIVDDGSTDATRQVADRLIRDSLIRDSRMRDSLMRDNSRADVCLTYHYQPNGGVASARNLGARHATGEWIQFLDADDWIAPDKIQRQLDHAAAVGETELVLYADYERVYVDSTQMQTVLPSASRVCVVGQLDAQRLIARLLVCPDSLAKSPFPLLQQAMLFKRGLVRQTPFDETLKACEDRAFALALLVRGVPFVYVPMVAAFYRKHSANMTDNRALMWNAYAQYFQTVGDRHPQLRSLYQPSLQYLLETALEECDRHYFEVFSQLVQFPVVLWGGKLCLSNLVALKLLYKLRQITPSFLLYERYRGPRSKRLLAKLSQWLPIGRRLAPAPRRSPAPPDPPDPPRQRAL